MPLEKDKMKLIKLLLIAAIIGIIVGFACQVGECDIVTLDSLYVDYKDYAILNDKNRDLLVYPESAKEGVNLGINTSILGAGYFNSQIEGTTTSSQYRGVGLQLQIGIRLSDYLDVGYYHHSQHVLDRPSGDIPHFAVVDAIELKIYIYRAHKSVEPTVFGGY